MPLHSWNFYHFCNNRITLDNNTKREMAEFCNKAGLKQHEYSDSDFKSFDELGGMDDIKQALQ